MKHSSNCGCGNNHKNSYSHQCGCPNEGGCPNTGIWPNSGVLPNSVGEINNVGCPNNGGCPNICTLGNSCDNAPALAMAYVEKQRWNEVYDAKIGLSRGTIFPALDKPFFGKEACTCGR